MPDVGVPEDASEVMARRENAVSPFAVYSGYSDSARVVVRNESQWREVWARIAGNATPAPEAPEIDFNTEMVLVAAMGTKPSGGWAIRIDRVARRGNNAWAEVTSQQPGSGCMTSAAFTAPLDVVVVQRTPGKVVFVERSEVRNC
ncbi:MAG TPA: protease complex subunit PrcB family protein [Gemmatimonadaceae bacterium]|nr:protease complex subunit PrcB family protein [Gemmatimonadaceae bacterium]